MRHKEPPSHIVEFDGLRGSSAIFMASAAKILLPSTLVISFNTFTGLSETNAAVDLYREGEFGKVDVEEFRNFAPA